jgi:hypothetical protein
MPVTSRLDVEKTYLMDSFTPLISSIGEACGEDEMKRTQNSFSSILRGIEALDIYTAWCLFHCLDIFPETSSMKIIRGTVRMCRPLDFSHRGLGIRAAKDCDESTNLVSAFTNINCERMR